MAWVVIPEPVQSQDQPPKVRTGWFSLGFGPSLAQPGPDGMIALAGDLNYQTGKHLLQVRGQGWLVDLDDNSGFAEVGLLYGRATRARTYHLAVAAGVGYGQVCDDFCEGAFGIPLMARAAFRPTAVLGLAAQAVANVNAVHGVLALQVLLEIGKLR